jgi:TolB-like protein
VVSDPPRRNVSGVDPTLSAPSARDVGAASRQGTMAPQLIGGRYEILALLGAGGMGSVYRARDTELDEVVALKMLHGELVNEPGMLARFRQEAKLARRVTHRNVARTFDIGEHRGDKFLTMELVEGESLASLAARRPRLPVADVVRIMREVCAGMAAAHAAGVVHRDLKPDNVLLGTDGRVVVTDFGIAYALAHAGRMTKTLGGVVGTPAYMAPEQVEGARDIDGRADIYAVGVMTYELLTGEPAWHGDTPFTVAAARLVNPPPDPRAILPNLPPALADLIMLCMARKREERVATAEALAEALAQASAAAPPPASTLAVTAPLLAARPGASAPAELDKTVAVLPFHNGGPPDDAYLADGLTDDLIDVLSMTPGLKVRPRGTVAHLRGQGRDPREVGKELGVQVVVEGSVRKTPAGVRVNARVLGVADGFQLWAKRFDRPAADALAMNDEAGQAIAEALTVHFIAKPRHVPTDGAAVDLYLRASHELAKFWQADVQRAVALYEQALEHAPDDPTILAGCARARVRLAFFGGAGSTEMLELAKKAAEGAIAGAPDHGEAWAALAAARFMAGDAPGAVRALTSALARAPGLAHAQELLGRILLEVGRVDDAVARLRTGLSIDPSMLSTRWELVRMYALLGDWSASDALMELPAPGPGGRLSKYLYRTRFAVWRDQFHPDLNDPPEVDLNIGALTDPKAFVDVLRTHELSDAHRERIDLASARVEKGSRRRALFYQLNAELYAFCFEIDRALAAIEESVDAGLLDLLWMDRCPVLEPVRKDARFLPMRARVNERAQRVIAAFLEPKTGERPAGRE